MEFSKFLKPGWGALPYLLRSRKGKKKEGLGRCEELRKRKNLLLLHVYGRERKRTATSTASESFTIETGKGFCEPSVEEWSGEGGLCHLLGPPISPQSGAKRKQKLSRRKREEERGNLRAIRWQRKALAHSKSLQLGKSSRP